MPIVSIFYNVHTYLVISFILTIFLVSKFAWRKAMDSLQANIDSVKSLIDNLKEQKKKAEERIERLERETTEYKKIVNENALIAQSEAKKISKQSKAALDSLISKKQEEYRKAIANIKNAFYSDLQNKIVKMIEKELISKIKESKDNKEIQDINIDNAAKMIGDVIRKHKCG